MDQIGLQSSDIENIIDAHEGRIHDQEVGALLGQLVVLARDLRHDAVTRGRYCEALGAALAFDPHRQEGPAVVWMYGVAPTPRGQRRTAEKNRPQYRQNRRRPNASRLFR